MRTISSKLNIYNDDFIKISYGKILDEIIKNQTNGTQKIKVNKYHILNVSTLADAVAKNLNSHSIKDILGISSCETARNIFSTLNFDDELLHNTKLKELRDLLNEAVKELSICPTGSKQFSRDISRNNNLGLNLDYKNSKAKISEFSFSQNSLSSQPTASSQFIRQDRAIVSIDVTNMEDDIEMFLISYYKSYFKHLDEDDLDFVIECVKNRDVLVNKIRDYIITLRNGYLKRVIEGPLYINFINDILKEVEEDKNSAEAYKLFDRYVARANNFEKYIQNSIVNDGDDTYVIEYLNSNLDFIHSIKVDSIYELLPFTGLIKDPPLSDTKLLDRSKGSEMYGVHIKRNGEVMASGDDSSFEYHLNSLISIPQKYTELKSDKQKFELAKVELEELCELDKHGKDFVKALILKYMLLNLEDENYNALDVLKSDLLKYKEQKLNTPEKVILAIRELIIPLYKSKSSIISQLSKIKTMIGKALSRNDLNYSKEYTKKFFVLSSILPHDEDLSTGILLEHLKLDENYQINPYNKLFKYTALLDEDLDSNCYAYSFEYKITLKSEIFQKPIDSNFIDIQFNNENFNSFIVGFYPKISDIKTCSKEKISNVMNDLVENELQISKSSTVYPAVFIEYPNEYSFIGSSENEKLKYKLVYDITYTFIVSILMSLISDRLSDLLLESKAKDNPELLKDMDANRQKIYNSLYLSIMQLTFNTDTNGNIEYTESQSFIYELRKSLASAMSSKNTANSQGFNVLSTKYKAQNAINSLFSKMDKIVTLHRDITVFKKTAIIVASSRHHDRSKAGRERENVTLHCEIITVDRLSDKNKINISSYGEFTQFLSKEDLHKNPTILADKIKELSEIGYKDVLYLAKSPFTANMIEKRDKTEMYFMNEEIIKSMVKDVEDVTIYPLYMNNSKVHIGPLKNTSTTNIVSAKHMRDDLEENLVGTIPLFEIFSDISVGNKERTFYNEAVVYSTIKGVYSEEVMPYIGQNNLLDKFSRNSYMNDLMLIITSIHLSRNEQYVYGPKLKTIKNNPFSRVLDISKGTNGISIAEYKMRGSRGSDTTFKINRFALVSHIGKVLSK